jgi:hydroxymethylglutaryl-CoA lyase
MGVYAPHVAEHVRITDVSPRDGLQNEAGVIPTVDKARLVGLLCAAGVDEVEVTSFVSAKWVPQLGDGAEVLGMLRAPLQREGAGERRVMLSALVPNERGMQGATEVCRARPGLIGKVSVFTAASETFARKNTNASIAETIERFRPVVDAAHAEGLVVRGYVSCVIACPFEGAIEPENVAAVSGMLRAIGVDELDLGDTIGAGTPGTVGAMLAAVERVWPRGAGLSFGAESLTLHLHDTFGRAAECVRAALDMGVRSFDGSVAGLGGCPYASTPGKRAPGNIDTRVLVETIHGAGYVTGVDLCLLEEAAEFAREIVTKSRAGA